MWVFGTGFIVLPSMQCLWAKHDMKVRKVAPLLLDRERKYVYRLSECMCVCVCVFWPLLHMVYQKLDMKVAPLLLDRERKYVYRLSECM